MTRVPFWLMLLISVVLPVLGGSAISAQDKYTVQCRVVSRCLIAGDTKTGRKSLLVTPKTRST
jgi:hypothetical protein